MKNLIILVLMVFSSVVYSQSENDKVNRSAFQLEIAANETYQYSMDVPESPYFVHEKVLQLFCTETVFVECEIEQDTISSMKVVAENLHPQKTIVIRFTQNSEDRKKISSELKVKNPFQKSLVYDAMMFTPNSQDWQSTSIIPIQPQLENYELWPHAIVTLVLERWRFE